MQDGDVGVGGDLRGGCGTKGQQRRGQEDEGRPDERSLVHGRRVPAAGRAKVYGPWVWGGRAFMNDDGRMPSTRLLPMTEEAFAAYLRAMIPEYAKDKVAAGQWTEGEAMQRSEASYAALLPQGLATPGQHLYSMVDDDGTAVGMVWIGLMEEAGRPMAFVYDVAVDAAQRRKGHAGRAFVALEAICRDLGVTGIGLHVFGHNEGARALYRKLGYRETNVNMFKALQEG